MRLGAAPPAASRPSVVMPVVAAAAGAARQTPRVLKAACDRLLRNYLASTPSAAAVVERVFAQPGGYGADQVVHDHLAFRTFGVPGLGIEALGAALEAQGYTRQDYYTFPRTHLLAAWYAPPAGLYGELPRMFVSQLQVGKLSPAGQAIIRAYTGELESAAPGSASLGAWTAALTGALPWRTPSREDYQALLQESEYGAWVLVNGFALNHTALSVHQIKGRSGDIYGFANELVMKGFPLNGEGGIMKVSPDSGLLQCSTVADMVDFRFADGQVHPVVGAYMEFVERKPLPQHEHLAASGQLREEHRRDGFEAQSAANIFASTTLAAKGAQEKGLL